MSIITPKLINEIRNLVNDTGMNFLMSKFEELHYGTYIDSELMKAFSQMSSLFDPNSIYINTSGLEDKNGYSFVLKTPILEQYILDTAFIKYLQFGVKALSNQKILILGGGTGQKELGLLFAYVFRKTGSLRSIPNILFTDKFINEDNIVQYLYSLAKLESIPSSTLSRALKKIEYQELDITNQKHLKRVIEESNPDYIVLMSVISIFDEKTQLDIVETISNSTQDIQILFGTVLTTGIQAMYGQKLEVKVSNVLASILEYANKALSYDLNQDIYNYLNRIQSFDMSKFINDFGYASQIHVEYSGFITFYENMFVNNNFSLNQIYRGTGWNTISNGFKSLAVPVYCTFSFEKNRSHKI